MYVAGTRELFCLFYTLLDFTFSDVTVLLRITKVGNFIGSITARFVA